MKTFMIVVLLTLWSSEYVSAKSLYMSGTVPLTGEVQIKHDKDGKLIVKQAGHNNLKLKRVQKRMLASTGVEISAIVLEAP